VHDICMILTLRKFSVFLPLNCTKFANIVCESYFENRVAFYRNYKTFFVLRKQIESKIFSINPFHLYFALLTEFWLFWNLIPSNIFAHKLETAFHFLVFSFSLNISAKMCPKRTSREKLRKLFPAKKDVCRSQKRQKDWQLDSLFCAFKISARKNCS